MGQFCDPAVQCTNPNMKWFLGHLLRHGFWNANAHSRMSMPIRAGDPDVNKCVPEFFPCLNCTGTVEMVAQEPARGSSDIMPCKFWHMTCIPCPWCDSFVAQVNSNAVLNWDIVSSRVFCIVTTQCWFQAPPCTPSPHPDIAMKLPALCGFTLVSYPGRWQTWNVFDL